MDGPDQPHLVVLRRTVARAVALAGACLCASCATFIPPISYGTTPDSTRQGSESPRLTLRVLEGRPSGPLLAFGTRFSADAGATLRLVRDTPSGPTRTLWTLKLGPERARRLSSKGLRFVDESVSAGTEYRYRALYEPTSPSSTSPDPDMTKQRSETLTIHWHRPPKRPRQVDARATSPTTVEVSWRPEASGALVFRRDVLADDSESTRFTERTSRSGGVVLDRSVNPGGVYAYQIALAAERDGYIQYGPASEPLYVSIPRP